MFCWEVWNPTGINYVSRLTILVLAPSPPSHDWCMVRAAPLPPHLVAMVGQLKPGPVPLFLNTLNSCHTDLWQVDWLSSIITINFNISLFQLSIRKSKLTLILRLSLCLLSVRTLGCLELFSKSHLSIFWPPSTGLASCLTITRTIWSEWTQAW